VDSMVFMFIQAPPNITTGTYKSDNTLGSHPVFYFLSTFPGRKAGHPIIESWAGTSFFSNGALGFFVVNPVGLALVRVWGVFPPPHR